MSQLVNIFFFLSIDEYIQNGCINILFYMTKSFTALKNLIKCCYKLSRLSNSILSFWTWAIFWTWNSKGNIWWCCRSVTFSKTIVIFCVQCPKLANFQFLTFNLTCFRTHYRRNYIYISCSLEVIFSNFIDFRAIYNLN